MDLNLTGHIATNVSLMLPIKTDYTPLIGPIVVGLLGLLGIAIGQYVIYKSDKWKQLKEEKAQMARLAGLESLMKANRQNFNMQLDAAYDLLGTFSEHENQNSEISTSILPDKYGKHSDIGIDSISRIYSSRIYPNLSPDEKATHDKIRNVTIEMLRPINESMLNWLDNDTYFRGQWGKNKLYDELSEQLSLLQTHLLLWRCTYDILIPDHPENAVVFVYAVPFPKNLDEIIESIRKEARNKRWWKFWR
jgi:hypothetical protein